MLAASIAQSLNSPPLLYILDAAARTQWQHSIPPTKQLRYSITMRTLTRKPLSH
jgi:hypothetical protein